MTTSASSSRCWPWRRAQRCGSCTCGAAERAPVHRRRPRSSPSTHSSDSLRRGDERARTPTQSCACCQRGSGRSAESQLATRRRRLPSARCASSPQSSRTSARGPSTWGCHVRARQRPTALRARSRPNSIDRTEGTLPFEVASDGVVSFEGLHSRTGPLGTNPSDPSSIRAST